MLALLAVAFGTDKPTGDDFRPAESKRRVYPWHKASPKHLVQTAGANTNHRYVVPNKDLLLVRSGDGKTFDKGF